MNIQFFSNKKSFNLKLVLVALLGVLGVFSNANARTQYLFTSGAPACGTCHETDPVKGLLIGPTIFPESPGVKGPLFPSFDKIAKFCQRKLHDVNATYNWVFYESVTCEHGVQEASVLAPAIIGAGVVTESDALGNKKSANAATDIWAVTCPAEAVQLTVSVKDEAPKNPALVSIQIKKGDAASTTSIDTSESKPAFSQDVTLAAGADVYDVLINKTEVSKVGLENYTAKFACKDVDGNVLDITAIEKTQDQ